VPPFGHATQLCVFVDPDLFQYDESGHWPNELMISMFAAQ